MMPRMNHGAVLPMNCSASPPAEYADDARSFSTMAAARQNEMKASMAVVATSTFVTGRARPGVNVGPVELETIYFEYGQELYVEMRPKRKSRGEWHAAKGNYSTVIQVDLSCSVARSLGWRALCGGFFWRRAKVALASLAGTNFAQMFEAENSCSVAIGKLDLHGVVSHCVSALGGDARFVHGQQRRARTGAALGFLLALVVAQRAGAMIAQVREIVAAGVLVRPSDLHALARRDVYLNAHRFFSRVLCYGHWKFSLRLGNLLLASVPRPKRREFPPRRSP